MGIEFGPGLFVIFFFYFHFTKNYQLKSVIVLSVIKDIRVRIAHQVSIVILLAHMEVKNELLKPRVTIK